MKEYLLWARVYARLYILYLTGSFSSLILITSIHFPVTERTLDKPEVTEVAYPKVEIPIRYASESFLLCVTE